MTSSEGRGPVARAGGRLERPRSRGPNRWRRGRRGVSEVVATILLLALTVTLFGAIFAFVTRFPSPPAQAVNQFQASTAQNASGITGLTILQSSGPTVAPGDNVILQASNGAHNWQFNRATGIPVSWGMGNSTTGWSTGQYWTTSFSPALKVPVNITIYILSTTSLLFTGVVPGYTSYIPPVVTSTYTIPATPTVKGGFRIFAVVSGNTSGLAVNVSLSEVPGLSALCSGPCSMTYNSTAGAYNYAVPAGDTTTNGTYLGFIAGVSSATGATISGSVQIKITGSGGGGTTTPSYTATVAPALQPPYTPSTSAVPSIYLEAVINYTGTLKNVPVWVNFTISQLENGRASAVYVNASLPGQTGDTISGPGVLTVYSQSPYGSWLLNSTLKLTAAINLQGVGKLNATNSLVTAALVTGLVYVTTASGGSYSSEETTMTYTCTVGTNCPYLYVNVSNTFSSEAVTFSGTVWSNVTSCASGTCTATSYTIASTTAAANAHTWVDVAGSKTQWKPGGSPGAGSKFTIAMLLTISISGTTIGYVYNTWVIT